MRIIGATKKTNVAISKECSIKTFFTPQVTAVWFGPTIMLSSPNCKAWVNETQNKIITLLVYGYDVAIKFTIKPLSYLQVLIATSSRCSLYVLCKQIVLLGGWMTGWLTDCDPLGRVCLQKLSLKDYTTN